MIRVFVVFFLCLSLPIAVFSQKSTIKYGIKTGFSTAFVVSRGVGDRNPSFSGILPSFSISAAKEQQKGQLIFGNELRLYRDGARYVIHWVQTDQKITAVHARYNIGINGYFGKLYQLSHKKKSQLGITSGIWVAYTPIEYFRVDREKTWDANYAQPFDGGISVGGVFRKSGKHKKQNVGIGLNVYYGFANTGAFNMNIKTRSIEMNGIYFFKVKQLKKKG